MGPGQSEQHLPRPPSVPRRERQESGASGVAQDLQRQAWEWALANRAKDGSLPSGREIARHYGRHERWGRLVKRSGVTGELAAVGEGSQPGLRLVEQRPHRAHRAVTAPGTLIGDK